MKRLTIDRSMPLGDRMERDLHAEACKELWFSVIERAIRDAEGDFEPRVTGKQRITEEALDWLKFNEGFVTLCNLVDLDPSWARKKAVQAVGMHTSRTIAKEKRRSREYAKQPKKSGD